MKYVKARKLSIFRKIALSLWGAGGDPSVYGFLEIDVTHRLGKNSPMPLVIKALGEVMQRHPEVNSILRLGRLYYRNHINISVMVNIVEAGKQDLSFMTLRDVDKMSLQEISDGIQGQARVIRKREDPHLGFAFKLLAKMPPVFIGMFLKVYGLLTHDLDWNLSFLRLPRDPFGSVVVTNVGSLGVKKALIPLVPFSRSAVLISIGEVTKEPRVVNDKIEVREIMHLGVTFDHRFFDGSQAAMMIRDFEDHFFKLTVTG